MIKTFAIAFFVVCPAAFGQLFSFGVRGGVPLTSAYSSGNPIQVNSGSTGYLVGPMVELHLPFGPPSFRTVSGNEGNFSSAGFTLGVGVEVKLLRLRVEPELRYIRWGSGNGLGSGASIPSGTSVTGTSLPVIVPANLNQVEFSVGMAF